MADVDARITDLEVRFAFVEEMLNELNSVVTRQDRALIALGGELERLRGELAGNRNAMSHDVRDEPPPPHY